MRWPPKAATATEYGIAALLAFQNLDLLHHKYELDLAEVHATVRHGLLTLLLHGAPARTLAECGAGEFTHR